MADRTECGQLLTDTGKSVQRQIAAQRQLLLQRGGRGSQRRRIVVVAVARMIGVVVTIAGRKVIVAILIARCGRVDTERTVRSVQLAETAECVAQLTVHCVESGSWNQLIGARSPIQAVLLQAFGQLRQRTGGQQSTV